MNGFDAQEAVDVASATLMLNQFRIGADGRFSPRTQVEVPEMLVLIDETYAPVTARCVARLVLRKGAISSIRCEGGEQ